MREIEFRGKNEYGKWFYGSLVNFDEKSGYVYILESFTQSSTLPIYALIKENLHLIDIDTIGQYVGLKDKNGKKIFEGDIVNNGENENLIVLWSDYYQSFIINEKIGLYGDQSDDRLYDCDDIIEEYEPFNYKCASYEVIGNCWDNPELLVWNK